MGRVGSYKLIKSIERKLKEKVCFKPEIVLVPAGPVSELPPGLVGIDH